LPIWEKLKTATADRNQADKAQCAKDLALAASFVRSLETEDREVNEELRQVAGQLDRVSQRLEARARLKAA
jgi:hypothetical protein